MAQHDPDTDDRPRRRFTADEVLRMVEVGVLGEDERVELIDGELVEMSPQSPEHAFTIAALCDLLGPALQGKAHLRGQCPIAAGPFSLPEPDLAIVLGSVRQFRQRHPTGAELLAVFEVAWSTAKQDRRKSSLYARAGVPTYWLIDLAERRLWIYAEPSEHGDYALIHAHGEQATVTLPGTDLAVRVGDLLP